ncbi:MAG: hypothetical protein ACYCZW_00840 [Minisyncoccota bacterium]
MFDVQCGVLIIPANKGYSSFLTIDSLNLLNTIDVWLNVADVNREVIIDFTKITSTNKEALELLLRRKSLLGRQKYGGIIIFISSPENKEVAIQFQGVREFPSRNLKFALIEVVSRRNKGAYAKGGVR